jgi:hypothetical protein
MDEDLSVLCGPGISRAGQGEDRAPSTALPRVQRRLPHAPCGEQA